MTFRFDKNGRLKPYRSPISSTIVKVVGALTALAGLILLIIAIGGKNTAGLTAYAIAAIPSSALLYIAGNIADDLHHINYMLFLDRLKASRKRDQADDA